MLPANTHERWSLIRNVVLFVAGLVLLIDGIWGHPTETVEIVFALILMGVFPADVLIKKLT
jgi:hypothetical protein